MSNSEDNPDMRILRTTKCKSVTGNSLAYQLGVQSDSSVHIRITKNSGAGFFNDEWIAIKDIEKALAEGPKGQPLTSFMLQPLFTGRSSNSPGFMMAALTNERLLRILKGKKRGHEFLDPEGFNAKMDKLVSTKATSRGTTGGTIKKTVAKKAPSKKAVVKKQSVARRKQKTV